MCNNMITNTQQLLDGLAQARWLGEAESIARSYIAVSTGQPIGDVHVSIVKVADKRSDIRFGMCALKRTLEPASDTPTTCPVRFSHFNCRVAKLRAQTRTSGWHQHA